MEQNFQTSFIPQKPIVKERTSSSQPVSIFLIISLFVLFAVLLATGGLYFYKGVMKNNITEMEKTLNLAKNRFEPAKIAELQVLDKRLRASSEILSKHIATTPIFSALEKLTMKTVRYTDFSYELGTEKNAPVKVKMSGQAIGYRSIALQSDLFSKNKNFIDPVFSNLTLDNNGSVIFDLEFSVDPSFVNYKQTLLTES
ncbi:MAG: hypothetical protein UU10_C0015G0013 [Parcubacteria group bacterium GW2011_GWF1_40_6]|uniref:Fimbrial assembly family protein n=2 Tax=Candidatus Nomuraibacteriota TaxID=1752729 RepID=A0A0G0R1W6_9BACT|nr:MAG: hypothetical protein UT78_C0002G0046 [Candidatus Nomurabacteria bacterium GW2011_GWF2_40_12]KKR69183.1 MAG: hypothetical protein UU10_C0015G0013 [Parcubacteria group bacterium GW2011_GWF1_40_6]OGJ09352.1 MAG: hypothetical protein A2356_00670 [Candidatus Nomurabacteria bacterium RIFOXYB1_FULL_39_16]OGJ14520.1 MAG: hypothetical protein A2585_02780 [Candidatus Nomurabacteria bacterium RIFOXYD1_FULL_39_12]